MGRFWQATIVAAGCIALGGCKKHDRAHGAASGENQMAPLIDDPHVPLQSKLGGLAAQVDAVSTLNVHQHPQGKIAPHIQNNGFIIDADFIYWKAHEDGLEYATRVALVDGDIDSGRLDPRGLHFNWDPGFRLGVGYLFGQSDQWDLDLGWTYLHSTAHSHSYYNNGADFYFPNWYPGLLGLFADAASANWSMTLNTLDLELGRNYFAGKAFALRPMCGIRAATIRQHYNAAFQALSEFTPGVLTSTPSKFKAHNYFAGAGLRAGADLLWHLSHHWVILGKFAGSLLYGHFNVDERGSIDSAATPTLFRTKRSLHRVRANLEAFLGLQYETEVFHRRNHISYSLGYELSEWFQQNQLVQVQGATSASQAGFPAFTVVQENAQDGNLDFQGVTFKVCYNF